RIQRTRRLSGMSPRVSWRLLVVERVPISLNRIHGSRSLVGLVVPVPWSPKDSDGVVDRRLSIVRDVLLGSLERSTLDVLDVVIDGPSCPRILFRFSSRDGVVEFGPGTLDDVLRVEGSVTPVFEDDALGSGITNEVFAERLLSRQGIPVGSDWRLTDFRLNA